MTSAAVFLVARNLKNRVVRSVMRLRQPRYIAGGLLAVMYFWMFFVKRTGGRSMADGRISSAELLSMIVTGIALVIIIGAWALPGDAPGLVFSEAEIQFLFAGPVSRRQLVAYKMIRTQVQTLFSAVIFSFFVFRGSHFLGMWIALMVLDVYTTFVSFARARLKLAGVGWIWRMLAVTLIVIAIAWIAGQQIRETTLIDETLNARPKNRALMHATHTMLLTPPIGAIMAVPRLFGTLLYGQAAALSAGAILIVTAIALFFLTTKLDVSFEDASLVASQRAMVRRARRQSRGRGTSSINRFPPLFRLGDTGRPEVAIIWKNLIGIVRMSSFPIVAVVLPVVIAAGVSIWGPQGSAGVMVGFLALGTAALFVFAGPQVVRGDMRVAILRLDTLKTFPMSAEALLASEMAAPLIVVSIFELLMVTAGVTILSLQAKLTFFSNPEFVVSAIVFIIPISAMQLLIQNAAIILFPAWTISPDGGRGFTAMGQRFLFLVGNLFTLTVSILPAAAIFLPGLWVMRKIAGGAPWGVLVATIPAVAVIVVEIVIAHKLLAAQFEEIDVANDLDAVSS